MNLIKPQLRASRIFMIVAVSVAVACSAADNSFASGAFFGSRGTHFADVNKDGRADAIAVEDSGVWVRISTGTAFSAPENWSHEPFYGTRGTYFADVDGDGRADAIAVTDEAVYVRKSTGADFAPWSAASNWSHEPYYGSVSTQFADVTGDGKADAIAVSGSNIYVRPSRGSDFAPWTGVSWMNFPFDRARSVQFADVCDCSINGVGKRYSADAVIVMDGGVYVGISISNTFTNLNGLRNGSSYDNWSHEPYYGSHGTYFADVTGDKKADAIAVNDRIYVRRSDGFDFAPWTGVPWTDRAFYGSNSTHFADVTGDGRVDAIAVSSDGTYVLPGYDDGFFGAPRYSQAFGPWTGGLVSWT